MAANLVYKAATGLGLPASTLRRLARSAPHRYKVYTIAKRSGSGRRVIAQPAKEVKAVQRWLIANALSWMPLHEAATAYAPGSSIRDNALLHLNNRFLLKVDFANFFPSIEEADVRAHIEKYASGVYSPNEVTYLCRMLLWHPKHQTQLELCIGAPSSPFISNSIMYDFDVILSAHCSRLGVVYSRYADDLALSTNLPGILELLPAWIETRLRELAYPKLTLNERKTVSTSMKYRRSVTGLILANQGYVSLGRERKRLVSAMVHHFECGKLGIKDQARLSGLLAFVQDVEPAFILRLERRYSPEIVTRARRGKG